MTLVHCLVHVIQTWLPTKLRMDMDSLRTWQRDRPKQPRLSTQQRPRLVANDTGLVPAGSRASGSPAE